MWRGAVIPASVVGILATVGMTLARGTSSILGGVLAEFIVLIFFGIHLAISKYSRKLDPMMTMVLVLISYFAKLLILGVFLLVVVNAVPEKYLDRTTFGVVAVAITFAWLAGEVRAFLKLRLHLPLPGDASHNQSSTKGDQ
jgi:ATP synthase protein I